MARFAGLLPFHAPPSPEVGWSPVGWMVWLWYQPVRAVAFLVHTPMIHTPMIGWIWMVKRTKTCLDMSCRCPNRWSLS